MPTLQAGVSGQNVGDQWNGYPVSGPITSRFGIIDDAHPQPHSGNDVACDAGTLVRAPFAGQVVLVSRFGDGVRWTEIFGNSAVIRGEDGMRCLTAHYQDPPAVTVGQSVQAGDVLGAAGAQVHVAADQVLAEQAVELLGRLNGGEVTRAGNLCVDRAGDGVGHRLRRRRRDQRVVARRDDQRRHCDVGEVSRHVRARAHTHRCCRDRLGGLAADGALHAVPHHLRGGSGEQRRRRLHQEGQTLRADAVRQCLAALLAGLVVRAGPGVRQHQALHHLRVLFGERQRDVSTHRESDYDRLVDLRVAHGVRDVVRCGLHLHHRAGVHGAAEARHVRCQYLQLVAERHHLVPPHG